LGLGRFLPLGTPPDGAWITERAARGVLLTAVAGLPGARLDRLRLALADPDAAAAPAVPPPPSALPPGPLRITADLAATAAEPLPVTAARVRDTLTEAAALRLGLTVGEVDLR
ncbi:nucleopolyhedrovirus P10 family protein, partial [Streptomyces sp. TRM76130]|nr:nucleopolyhedrovirus P10 family protein [Streptomyces sp. TRM76130]